METNYIIELKNLEETPANITHGNILPYVRENYLNKFKDRLADDLFGEFVNNPDHYTGMMLTGDVLECLVIETDMFLSERESIDCLNKGNSHERVSTLFSTFFAIGIEKIAIVLRHDESVAYIFILCPPFAINDLTAQMNDRQINYYIIK